jgi:hypothetical protein
MTRGATFDIDGERTIPLKAPKGKLVSFAKVEGKRHDGPSVPLMLLWYRDSDRRFRIRDLVLKRLH